MATQASGLPVDESKIITITPLLRRLWPSPPNANPPVTAPEIAAAISHIFTNSLSPVQTGALLTALHFTGEDRKADVIALCAAAMRDAAAPIDTEALVKAAEDRGRHKAAGEYRGGLCDIVGTGGDSHSTFNVSTTASILTSPLLVIAKHGNRASTSKSGSADLLESTTPRPAKLAAITPDRLPSLYEKTSYAFLFAPHFHTSMRYVAPIRKELGWRTIFNLLGPLANPVHNTGLIEARVVGVARRDLGRTFAEALRLSGARKAMVVCGEEELDELSCAGCTLCWRLVERSKSTTTQHDQDRDGADVDIEEFTLSPADFGLASHALADVSPGKEPHENAEILLQILRNQLSPDNPILQFVLINAAALVVVSGLCDANESQMGSGDDGSVVSERGPGGGRWKEGVRRVRWAIESGAALREWEAFVAATHQL
ncbi:MAG: anthranilate phosphoribosyltransferase [Bathelium mastoideum]|nr:MAG: anthranilate phosphoribosyltransferase [Bathelium mastoideum]